MTAAAITIRSGSGIANPVHAKTFVHIEATDLPRNVTQTEEHILADPPVLADPITYVIRAECVGQDDLVSQVFQGPGYEWDGVIFPAAGSWTITVYDTSDGSYVVQARLTVD
jgi:hypothetical protein